MRSYIILIFLVILSSVVSAVYQKDRDLTSYPWFLFDMASGERDGEYYKTLGGTFDIHFTGSIVVSDVRDFPEINAANYLVNELPKTKFLWLNPVGENAMIRAPQQDFEFAIKKISEIDDIRTMDAVLIGLPCTNELVQDLLGVNKENCNNYLKLTEGKVIVQQHGTAGFYTTFIITGGSGEALFEATKKFNEAMKDVRTAKKFEGLKDTTFTLPQVVLVKSVEKKSEVRDVKKIIEQQRISQVKDQINKDIQKVKKKLFLL